MTCIVGLIHDGGVIVGADSAVTVGDLRGIDRRKVRRRWGVLDGTHTIATRCHCGADPHAAALAEWVDG